MKNMIFVFIIFLIGCSIQTEEDAIIEINSFNNNGTFVEVSYFVIINDEHNFYQRTHRDSALHYYYVAKIIITDSMDAKYIVEIAEGPDGFAGFLKKEIDNPAISVNGSIYKRKY